MGIFGTSEPGQARYSGELHNLQLTQSVFGTTVPIIFGTRRVAAKLLFYGGFFATVAPSQGGKGGGSKGATEFEYFADVIGALAAGSSAGGCRALLNVWDQQGKLANQGSVFGYTVPGGGGSVSPIVTGGAPIQQDLGVSKTVSYSVAANDYGSGGSRTLTGTQKIALQKVTGTPAAGQYSFNPATSTYIFAAADAGAVLSISYSCTFSLYYFSQVQAAQVPNVGPYQISTDNQAYFWSDGGVFDVTTGLAVAQGAGTNGYTESAGVYTFTSDLAGHYVYITYTYTSSDSNISNSSTLNLTLFNGAVGQAPSTYMQSKYPGSAFGFTGICYFLANPMALGLSATMPSYNYEIIGLDIFPGGGLDAHPCDCLRTLLYDAFLGVGFPSANVDAWTSCFAYWAANNYLISTAIDTQTTIADAMGKVIETGNVAAVWSAGLLKLIPYGDATCVGNGYTYTPATTPVVTLTSDDLLPSSEGSRGSSTKDDPVQVTRRAAKDCWNYMQAQYSNRINDYNNDLVNEQNDAFIARYGRRIESPQNWDWITSSAVAAWALRLRLMRQCYLRNTYKFWLDFRFAYLEPMDVIVLPSGEPVRITQIEEDGAARLAIEAEQFQYGTGSVSVYPKQPPTSFQPSLSSADPGNAIPIIVQNTTVQSSGIQNKLQIAASGQNMNWGGCIVNVSLDGTDYVSLGTVLAPSVIGLLSAALPSSGDPDTTDTLSVDIGLSVPGSALSTVTQLQADQFTTLCAIVDQVTNITELVAYETVTSTATNRYGLTYLRRGVYGTTPAAHTAGAWFAFLGIGFNFLEYQYPQNFAGGTIYVKLQSFNLIGARLQVLAQCAVFAIPITFVGCTADETYVPSSFSDSMSGTGWTISTEASAYDKDFTTYALLDSASPGSSNSASITYSGFPSVVITEPMTLYVNYRNLQGAYDSIGPPHGFGGGQATVSVFIAAVNVANPVNSELNGVIRALPRATMAVTIPAGTNLSTVTVVAEVQWTPVTGTPIVPTGPAHIEIGEIWIQ